ncbi:peptidase family M13 [Ancylostoma caninum]|uniref:Peptidase family M13 n=1 Tax=Ancylostoma caninum TaxID=29170 RepID=A0A368FQN8_ANCCA|nr:peptidase family M13 [Ancylostoma caninum]
MHHNLFPGLLAAHKAFSRQIKKGELRLPGLERYTPEQIFWITYGNSLCTHQTDLNLFLKLQEGSYSPSQCRVNQALQNLPAFAHDFACIPDAPMAPTADKQCPVWRNE